jgi:glycosyltransferase involved in cell wall biosynthesis
VSGLSTIPNLSYSAVLTVFNAERTVERAIQSILNQDLPAAEIIVIDDNSKDRSTALVEHFAKSDQRILLIQNSTNLGQAENRNVGVAHSKSDFVVFFDDDDESLPGRALAHEKMIQLGAETSYVSSEIYYMNGYSVPALNADYLGVIDFQLLSRRLLLGELSNNYANFAIPASTLAVRTSTFKRLGGFDPSLRRLEDVDFALKFSQSQQIFGFCSTPLVARHSTLSISKGNGIDMKYEAKLLFRYKDQFKHSEYTHARRHCRTRQLYFSKSYLSLLFHLLLHPKYSLKIMVTPRIYIRRLLHDYKKKSSK